MGNPWPAILMSYAGAMTAVALPLAGWWLLQSIYFDVLLEKAARSRGVWWAVALAGAMLMFIEWRCLSVLYHLTLARGHSSAFFARVANAQAIQRRRKRRWRMAAVSIGAFVAFLLAETVFRFLGIHPDAPPPSRMADYGAVNNALNQWGLRETWDVLPDDGRVRIAVLGDSMVYGDSVEREATFCSLLGEMLMASHVHGVRTINMGFWGTAPARQLEKYVELKDRVRANIVIHVVYPNDLDLWVHRRLDEIYQVRDDALWVGDASYVLCYAERTIRYWVAWNKTIDYFRGGRNSEERRQNWAKLKHDLRACKQGVEASGAIYALVMFPWLVRLDDYHLPDVHETMRAFASELDVPYLDLLEVFAGRDAETLRVSLVNEHPNPAGHRIAAEAIARFVRDEVLPLLP